MSFGVACKLPVTNSEIYRKLPILNTQYNQEKNLTHFQKGSVKFSSLDRNSFYPTLKRRVDEYFINNNVSKQGNSKLWIKTAVLTLIYVLPFSLLMFIEMDMSLRLLLWATMGLGIAGLGMSVMHDGNHGSYSSNKTVNFIMGSVLNLMGGSTHNWKMQNNILHHTYTNINEMDEDIASKPGLRLNPHTKVSKWHKYQWIHGFLLYGLTTLFWVSAKDFIQAIRYKNRNDSTMNQKKYRVVIFKIIMIKVIYFLTFLVVPTLVFDIPFSHVIIGFIIMHFVAGLVLSVIFQMAHSLDGTTHPLPNSNGSIENDWAIHQMNTTMNFSPRNKPLSWYIGGLNYQIEHHLFPKISHVHYPALSSIVKSTANEFGIPYLQHDTFGQALKAHVNYLKRLGRLPSLEEAID